MKNQQVAPTEYQRGSRNAKNEYFDGNYLKKYTHQSRITRWAIYWILFFAYSRRSTGVGTLHPKRSPSSLSNGRHSPTVLTTRSDPCIGGPVGNSEISISKWTQIEISGHHLRVTIWIAQRVSGKIRSKIGKFLHDFSLIRVFVEIKPRQKLHQNI